MGDSDSGRKEFRYGILVEDVDGVTIASLMFDAHYTSNTFIQVGIEKTTQRHIDNPILLADLFFRIGGFRPAKVHVDRAVELNSNDVISYFISGISCTRSVFAHIMLL